MPLISMQTERLISFNILTPYLVRMLTIITQERRKCNRKVP